MAGNSLAVREDRPLAASFTSEQIQLIKDTVAKNATDTELRLFLQVAAATGLNPFLKEIWFIKYQKSDGKWVGPLIMTSRDGYLSVANKHPDFEGIQSFAVYENDEFSYDADTNRITHRFTGKRGNLVGAWARVKRRGRDPVVAWAGYEEYKGTSEPWVKYPSAMTCKVAEAMGLKRQFTISGLVTQEELDVATAPPERPELPAQRPTALSGRPAQAEIVSPAAPPLPPDRLLSASETRKLREDVRDTFRAAGWRDDEMRAAVARRLAELGVSGVEHLKLHASQEFRRWAEEAAAASASPPAPEAPPAADEDADAMAHFAEL